MELARAALGLGFASGLHPTIDAIRMEHMSAQLGLCWVRANLRTAQLALEKLLYRNVMLVIALAIALVETLPVGSDVMIIDAICVHGFTALWAHVYPKGPRYNPGIG